MSDYPKTEDDVRRQVMAKCWAVRNDDGTYLITDDLLETIINLTYAGAAMVTTDNVIQKIKVALRNDFSERVVDELFPAHGTN